MRSSSLLSESICRRLVISLFALDRFQVGLCVFNCALLCRCAVSFYLCKGVRACVNVCSTMPYKMGGCLGAHSLYDVPCPTVESHREQALSQPPSLYDIVHHTHIYTQTNRQTPHLSGYAWAQCIMICNKSEFVKL